MTNNKKNSKNSKGMPLNDSPVIFNLHDEDAINYVGRYIESEGMFLLSLNDDSSDFVTKSDVKDWWYVDEHPIIQSEVLKNKVKKKYRRKLDDSKNKLESNSNTIFNSELFTADGLNNIKKILKKIDGYKEKNYFFILPIISLCNTHKLISLLKKKFKKVSFTKKKEWPLPPFFSENISKFKILKKQKKIEFKEKFGMYIAYTRVAICK